MHIKEGVATAKASHPQNQLGQTDRVKTPTNGTVTQPAPVVKTQTDDFRISDYSGDGAIVGTPIVTAAVRRAVKTGKAQKTKELREFSEKILLEFR